MTNQAEIVHSLSRENQESLDQNYKVLVVDDDRRLRSLLQRFLTSKQMQVEAVDSGSAMDRVLETTDVDLIVLDLMMPEEDGLSICKRLRADAVTTPIIMLTAKGSEEDRIKGLEVGADDYLPKPFNPNELIARIHSVLRRSQKDSQKMKVQISFDRFQYNVLQKNLMLNEKSISLTQLETEILAIFVDKPKMAVSTEDLAQHIQSISLEEQSISIEETIVQLQNILEEDPEEPKLLISIPSVGYMLNITV